MIALWILITALGSGADAVEIPAWRTVTLYPRAALVNLDSRFDLSPIRDGARLTIVAQREEGIFDVVLEEGTRRETLPVLSVTMGADPRERTLLAGERGVCVRLLLAGNAPLEASVEGMGSGRDQTYAAMARVIGTSLRLFASAEQELVEEYLAGPWDIDGRRVDAAAAGGSGRAMVRLGEKDFSLRIAGAPEGTDALLLPGDGSLPSSALRLRGPDALTELPVRCAAVPGTGLSCEVSGPGRRWRRGGARLNR